MIQRGAVEYIAHYLDGSERVKLRFPTLNEAKCHIHEFYEAKPTGCNRRLRDNKLKEQIRVYECNRQVATKLQDVRKRAKKKGWEYGLSMDWLTSKLSEQGYKCFLTGKKFQSCPDAFSRNPWGMSVDRIDSNVGYIPENCRVVCYAVNAAMNAWGEDVFREIANKYLTHKIEKNR